MRFSANRVPPDSPIFEYGQGENGHPLKIYGCRRQGKTVFFDKCDVDRANENIRK
jgi:hypothetical protein